MTTIEPPIRYSTDAAANAILRYALSKAGNGRCYACTEPKTYPDLQIDHLVPQSTSATDMLVLSSEHKPGGFGVDDPENLAVICSPCNGLKSNTDYTNTMRFAMHQRKAAARAEAVKSTVRSLRLNHDLATHLTYVASAQLTDDEARETYLTFAPGILATIATLGEEHLDFVTSETSRGSERDSRVDVRLVLDTRLRFARDLIKTIFDLNLIDLARAAADSLAVELEQLIQQRLAKGPDDSYDSGFDVGYPDVMHLELVVDGGEVSWAGGHASFKLSGTVDGWMNAHVIGHDPTIFNPERDSITDVWIYGPLTIEASLAADHPTGLEDIAFGLDTDGVDLDVDWGV